MANTNVQKHYNAFISYKHAEIDSEVASTVQRSLEHYRIPAKLQKKTGHKRIERIFRDKDELPITNNLGDTIQTALENSDYLIVICSPHTKESIWVQREIDYFLKSHPEEKVLTVLADGEPIETIPEVLLTDEKEIVDPDGSVHTIIVPQEPLSCDFRLPRKKALREELPRIVATLIGCTYDDLMNRQRQYKMRRMSAIFALFMAVAVGFGGYMMYSRDQIRQSRDEIKESRDRINELYEETLRSQRETLKNQSRYLANESKNLLNNEQRIEALQLALAALPSEGSDRPVIPEAIRALNDASMAYVSLDGSNIVAAWNYQMANSVEDFKLGPDNKTLAAIDSSGIVIVWDKDSHAKLFETTVEGKYSSDMHFKYLDSGTIMTYTSSEAIAYDIKSGKQVWTFTPDDYNSIQEESFLIDKDTLVLTSYDGILYYIDPKNGTLKDRIEIPHPEAETYASFVDYCLSPSNDKLFFKSYESLSRTSWCIYDIANDTLQYMDQGDAMLLAYEWADNDTLMISQFVGDSSTLNSTILDTSILSIDELEILCFNASDLSVRWTAGFETTGVDTGNKFLPLKGGENIAYSHGNLCRIYDTATGEMLFNHNVNDAIIDISDKDKDGLPFYITRSGNLSSVLAAKGPDTVSLKHYFADELDKADINNGVYVHQRRSKDIIYYGVYVHDEAWKKCDGSKDMEYPLSERRYMDEGSIALISTDDSSVIVYIYDPNTAKFIYRSEIGDDPSLDYQYKFAGADTDNIYIVHRHDGVCDLIAAGRTSGEVKTYDEDHIPDGLPQEIVDSLDYFASSANPDLDPELIPDALKIDNGLDLLGYTSYTYNDSDITVGVFSDGSLWAFNDTTGKFIGKTDMMVYSSGNARLKFTINQDAGVMCIQNGNLTNLIDLESLIELSYIQSCVGYHAGTDRFYTLASEDSHVYNLGYYQRYTTEDLIRKGKNILQGAEMSADQKSMYGIQDN
ncbi:MAG: TIR domain-containing protein [Lachnospiraceae bacterium]|nr:TIR domain-containing protein [Lachnospiraceae bacterium]